jgi:hypothetical protein
MASSTKSWWQPEKPTFRDTKGRTAQDRAMSRGEPTAAARTSRQQVSESSRAPVPVRTTAATRVTARDVTPTTTGRTPARKPAITAAGYNPANMPGAGASTAPLPQVARRNQDFQDMRTRPGSAAAATTGAPRAAPKPTTTSAKKAAAGAKGGRSSSGGGGNGPTARATYTRGRDITELTTDRKGNLTRKTRRGGA